MKICYPVKLSEDTATENEDVRVQLSVIFEYSWVHQHNAHWTVYFTAGSNNGESALPHTYFRIHAPTLAELCAAFVAHVRQNCILEDGDEAALLVLLHAAIQQAMAEAEHNIREYDEQERVRLQGNARALQTMTADAATFFAQSSPAAPEAP